MGGTAKNTSYQAGLGAQPAMNDLQAGAADVNEQYIGAQETYDPDFVKFNDLIAQQTELNRIKSDRYRQEYDPELAAADKAVKAQIAANVSGELDNATQNDLVKSGLMGSLQSGAKLGKGSVGETVAANLYGRGLEAVKAQRRAEAQQLLAQNPKETLGFDPGTLAQAKLGVGAAQTESRNAKRQSLAALTNARVNNMSNQWQQDRQAMSQQAAQNVANENQSKGAGLSFVGSLAGAGIPLL